jgi:hypothetical protein
MCVCVYMCLCVCVYVLVCVYIRESDALCRVFVYLCLKFVSVGAARDCAHVHECFSISISMSIVVGLRMLCMRVCVCVHVWAHTCVRVCV